jgi:Ca2+-binding EF-hand superfamily protein
LLKISRDAICFSILFFSSEYRKRIRSDAYDIIVIRKQILLTSTHTIVNMGNLHPARSERPELTERELSYITLHTHFTRKQINDFYIRFLTYYPRGSVNYDQFCDLYSNELKHLHNSKPLLERLFHHIDTDKNGQLNFKEILFFKAISMPETDDDEKIRWIFFLYDTDQDRQISEYEFFNLCHVAYHIHGKLLTKNRLNELKILFKKFDIDNDRQLNCEEFTKLCKQCTDLLELIAPMFNNTKWNSKVSDIFLGV